MKTTSIECLYALKCNKGNGSNDRYLYSLCLGIVKELLISVVITTWYTKQCSKCITTWVHNPLRNTDRNIQWYLYT